MEPLEVVTRYLDYLNKFEYAKAKDLLEAQVRVVGPSAEGFHSSTEFVEMLGKYRPKYDLRKSFSNGSDVCMLYDFVFESGRVYASSWYEVRNGKIASITTVFDPAKMPGSR